MTFGIQLRYLQVSSELCLVDNYWLLVTSVGNSGNSSAMQSVGDPWHFGADPDPRIRTYEMDPDPTPAPTPFFSDFKDEKLL